MAYLRYFGFVAMAATTLCGVVLAQQAPVLQNPDEETRVVTLPGPAAPPAPSIAKTPSHAPEAAEPVKASAPVKKPKRAADVAAAKPENVAPAGLAPAGPAKPPVTPEETVDTSEADYRKDPAAFLQSRIGQWGIYNAQAVFGAPRGERPSFDDDETVNGRIVAYADPSGAYREVELDFDKTTGVLRSLFLYPVDLKWQDCRRHWGEKAVATDANKGRTFYSYQDRHLDILVAPDGKVISLGYY
jgi:hypothetical protein